MLQGLQSVRAPLPGSIIPFCERVPLVPADVWTNWNAVGRSVVQASGAPIYLGARAGLQYSIL